MNDYTLIDAPSWVTYSLGPSGSKDVQAHRICGWVERGEYQWDPLVLSEEGLTRLDMVSIVKAGGWFRFIVDQKGAMDLRDTCRRMPGR